MTGITPPGAEPTPAERRVIALLLLLKHDDFAGRDPMLVQAVLRAARWQRSLRELLQAVGGLASAVATGIGTLVRGQGTGR